MNGGLGNANLFTARVIEIWQLKSLKNFFQIKGISIMDYAMAVHEVPQFLGLDLAQCPRVDLNKKSLP